MAMLLQTVSDETVIASEVTVVGDVQIKFIEVHVRLPLLTPRRAYRKATGDAVTLRMQFCADRPVPSPVFGVGIFRTDGLMVSGPNTKDFDLIPEVIEGNGSVELRIPRLLLLPGTYDVAVSCYDETITMAFDFIQKAIRFHVEPGFPAERHGMTSLGGTFLIELDRGGSAR